jgi:hypothetical protein
VPIFSSACAAAGWVNRVAAHSAAVNDTALRRRLPEECSEAFKDTLFSLE